MRVSRWKVPLECPRCGYTGEAVFSKPEDDDAAAVATEYVPGGFKVMPARPGRQKPDVVCSDCGLSALPRSRHTPIWARGLAVILPHFR